MSLQPWDAPPPKKNGFGPIHNHKINISGWAAAQSMLRHLEYKEILSHAWWISFETNWISSHKETNKFKIQQSLGPSNLEIKKRFWLLLVPK